MNAFTFATILVFFVSASLPAALPRGGTATHSSISPRPVSTKAMVSGLEKGSFRSLPPVLVELRDLPATATVWVEVLRGPSARRPAIGNAVESKFYLRRSGVGILSVPGIHRFCRSKGAYTLIVKMSDARRTVTLNQTSFELLPRPVASGKPPLEERSMLSSHPPTIFKSREN